jgi:hypothetical protein
MFVSALIYQGMAEHILDSIAKDKLHLYVSEKLRNEVFRKLTQLHATKRTMNDISFLFDYKARFFYPIVEITICRDPEDNFILELAEASQADYIITRDKDLLDLPDKTWKKTQIIKPEDFLPILRKMKIL